MVWNEGSHFWKVGPPFVQKHSCLHQKVTQLLSEVVRLVHATGSRKEIVDVEGRHDSSRGSGM